MQTNDPVWLAEAYSSPINSMDTGILKRNIMLSEKTAALIYRFFNYRSKFLDYAGGYGIFTRRMRDIGFDYYWHDLYTENLLSRNFEYQENLKKFELITAFECFEHFNNPLEDINKMFTFSKNIFFSTLLLPEQTPAPDTWWYYGFEHGQHIAFYSLSTLKYIAEKFDVYLYSNNSNLHLFTNRKLSPVVFKKTLNHSRKVFEKKIKKELQSKTFSDMEYIRDLK